MAYKNLNIPATLVHTVNGKKYTLNGKLLSINESAKTCSMRFGNEIADNVPLKEVYLNEAFLDDIKKFGRKAVDKVKHFWHKITDVVKSVSGFILPVNENGEEIEEFVNIPANIACVKLPASICYAPSDATLDICDEFGTKPVAKYDAETVFSIPEENDKAMIEEYWTRVMKEYSDSDMSLGESVRYVNKNYYRKTANNLNESVVSLHNIEDTYGPEIGTEELVDIVISSLLQQLNPVDKEQARPCLIWGAPGIGKTAILKAAARTLRDQYQFNFDITTVCCGAIKQDDFELPDTIKNEFDDKQVVSVPKTWLPVFNHNGLSKEQIDQMNDYYNSGRFKKRSTVMDKFKTNAITSSDEDMQKIADINASNDAEFDGGIIFFDEFGRLSGNAMQIMMTLCGDRTYADMQLASHWVMVAAANRLTDDMKEEYNADFWEAWDQAKFQRFQKYTYVPTKEEWIKWAREVNSNGYQNIDEIIVSFIEKAPDGVWYDALDLGSRNDYFKSSENANDKKFIETVNNISSGLSNDDVKLIGRYISNPSKSIINRKQQTWSGRTWDVSIAKKMLSLLKNELFAGNPKAYEACFAETTRYREIKGGLETEVYKAKNLSLKNLSQQLDALPDEKWYTWTKAKYPVMDKNQQLRKTDRLGFFITYVGQLISYEMGSDSLPSKEWQKHLKTSSVLDDVNIRFIWEQGSFKLNADKKDDNIFYPTQGEYSNNVTTSWKSDPTMVDTVCQEIWGQFDKFITPFMLKKDMKNYQQAAEKGNLFDPSLVDKWNKVYTINMINAFDGKPKKIELLFNNATEELTQKIASLLEYSECARRLANVALYYAKLSIQIGTNMPTNYLLGDTLDIKRSNDDTIINKSNNMFMNVKEYPQFAAKYQNFQPYIPGLTILRSQHDLNF